MPHNDSIYFYLHGRHGDREIELPLPGGTLSFGSSRASDLRLKLNGISRKHATLEVTESSVIVTDSGSTNGLTINGRRVDKVHLSPGSEIKLGPVTLRLSKSPDMDLAVAFDLAPEPSTTATTAALESTTSPKGFQDIPTAVMPSTALDSSESAIFEACLQALVSGSEGLGPALQVLSMLFRAEGAAFVRWQDSDPSVVSLHGQLGSVPDLETLNRSKPTTRTSAEWSASWVLPEVLTGAFKEREDGAHLGLLVWAAPPRSCIPHCLATLFELGLQANSQKLPSGRFASSPEPDLKLPLDHKRGAAPSMVELYDQMRVLLRGNLPVLISGETGVGKEGIARTLHLSSDRCDQPFVAVNCAAIPEDLLEAELFGIEKGAATGVTSRIGCFREADRGVIFLDEIGEMPMGLQAKLLRTLQEGEVRPIGGRPIQLDVRILSATNVDLDHKIEGGFLRRDLFYRLAGFVLNVPPLRQRRTDIPGLIEHLLRKAVQERAVRIRGLSVQAMRQLIAYDWPGNVRQLEHEVRAAAYRCEEGGIVQAAMLSEALQNVETTPSEESSPGDSLDGASDLRLAPHVGAVERRVIRQALERTGGNRKLAAVLLGISRNGLALKMERLGIELNDGDVS